MNNNYQSEVLEKWGKTDAYKEYSEKASGYTEEKYSSLAFRRGSGGFSQGKKHRTH